MTKLKIDLMVRIHAKLRLLEVTFKEFKLSEVKIRVREVNFRKVKFKVLTLVR
jgi:hypothetical protein